MVVAGPNKLITVASGGTKTAAADVFWDFITIILFLMVLSKWMSFQNQICWPLMYII